jgi:hypothetical protein
MTLYPVSFLLAVLFMLPQWAEWQDKVLPLQGLLIVPAIGLGYMATFFHEIGHCVTQWLFGYPAFPVFDVNHGGGLALHGERNIVLRGAIYFLYALAAFWLVRHRAWGLVAVLGAWVVVHIALDATIWHDSAINYMGQGAEVAVGAFLLRRGVVGHNAYGAAEKWLNMIAAQFFLLNAAFMDYTLWTDDISRDADFHQKGTTGFGDFTRIAADTGAKIENVAAVALLVVVLVTIASVIGGVMHRRSIH